MLLKRTYGMCNICDIRLPQAMGDVISSIGTAAADSIGYRAPARYWSNPNTDSARRNQLEPAC